MLYLINKLLSIVSSDFYFFLLKKTQLVAYNAEITTAEITVIDLDLYGEHMPEKELQGQKPTSTVCIKIKEGLVTKVYLCAT